MVGLGIAGLRAAMLLENAGIEVALFEARNRLGGRLFTTPEGDEAGGEWLDSDHFRILSLVDELDLRRISASGRRLLDYNGARAFEDQLWPEAKEDWVRLRAAAAVGCHEVHAIPWENPEAAELDRASLAYFVSRHCDSELGRWYASAYLRSDEGEDVERISLLGWLAGYKHHLERAGGEMSAYRIEGGAASLIGALASRLKAEPRYGCVLKRVSQDSAHVTLDFENFSERADTVLLTLPPPCLTDLAFDPGLPGEKLEAIEGCALGRITKVCMDFSRPFWAEEGWEGHLLTSHPIQQLWTALGQEARLTAYVCGAESEAARHWDAAALQANAVGGLGPAAASALESVRVYDWKSEPFTRGGFSFIAPGYAMGPMRHLWHPVGRVHFAGEHTAFWTGFIEGAVESGERAANEILHLGETGSGGRTRTDDPAGMNRML